jgi:adenine C2-methylase RlmN of 23S rRNA A2503 and tRNA A37
MKFTPIFSSQDQTVNFVADHLDGGKVETRFVRRKDEYFITYLSSQTGCVKGCKFCHLTATNQTTFTHVDRDLYDAQARTIFSYYKSLPQEQQNAQVVHFDFMVRGEPLANKHILTDGFNILSSLSSLARDNNLIPKFNISTIMPVEASRKRLASIFSGIYPTIYYSLYSLNDAFRTQWMPQAMDPYKALDILAAYQQDSKKIIKIHGCIIDKENDSLEDWYNILEEVKKRELMVSFNIVKYNPYSDAFGKEASTESINKINELIKQYQSSKIIERVGFDVKASCGMFV